VNLIIRLGNFFAIVVKARESFDQDIL